MNKIEKFLRKLSQKDQEAFLLLMYQIKKDFRKVPGLKKLTEMRNSYRVRVGRYRMIFKVTKKDIEFVKITKRDERTYKGF